MKPDLRALQELLDAHGSKPLTMDDGPLMAAAVAALPKLLKERAELIEALEQIPPTVRLMYMRNPNLLERLKGQL